MERDPNSKFPALERLDRIVAAIDGLIHAASESFSVAGNSAPAAVPEYYRHIQMVMAIRELDCGLFPEFYPTSKETPASQETPICPSSAMDRLKLERALTWVYNLHRDLLRLWWLAHDEEYGLVLRLLGSPDVLVIPNDIVEHDWGPSIGVPGGELKGKEKTWPPRLSKKLLESLEMSRQALAGAVRPAAPTASAEDAPDDGKPFYKPSYFKKWNIGDELLRRNKTHRRKYVEGKVRRQKKTPASGKGIRPMYWYSEPDARKRWPERFAAADGESRKA